VITAEKIEKASALMAEMVKQTLGPKVRQELKDWLDRPIVIDSASLRVKTTLGAWLQVVVAASEVGWQSSAGLMKIGAEDARALAGALRNVRLNGPNWTPLIAAVVVAGMVGEIRVQPAA